MNRFLVICIIGLSVIISCNHKEKAPYIIIDLENTINKIESVDLELNDIAEITGIIPIETNDSVLFRYVFFGGIVDESIVVHDGKTVYFIDKTDGRVISTIDRHGQGPEEYNKIMDCFPDQAGKTVFLYDAVRGATKEYSFNGNFIRSISGDSIGFFRKLDDGNFAVSYPPHFKSDFALGIYDNSWTLKRKGIAKKRDMDLAMLYYDAIDKFNDGYYYKLAFCDTLYRITAESDEPHLFVSKGRYKFPVEYAASLSELDEHGYKYVEQDYGHLVSKYYFLSYYYNRNEWFEVWDTEKSTLIYRTRFGRTGGTNGIPVVIDGKRIAVWPSHASGNYLYCLIEGDDALTVIPSLPTDTNPIILEVKIK